MPLGLDDLDNPDFKQLPPEEQYKGRREVFQHLTKTDPDFRALPPEERGKVLFPEGVGPQPVAPARPKPTIAEQAASGWERLKNVSPTGGPKAFGFSLKPAAQAALGASEIVGSLAAPATNLVTTGAEKVADYLKDVNIPFGAMGRTGGGPLSSTNLGDVAGATASAIGDYATTAGPAMALQKAKPLLAKALPYISEKVGALNVMKGTRLAANQEAADQAMLRQAQANPIAAERDARLAAIEEASSQARQNVVQAQGQRQAAIPGQQAAAEGRMTAGKAQVQADLAAQQAAVGKTAAEAAAPIPPRRQNFQRRYESLEKASETIHTNPENLTNKAYGITREPGKPTVLTNPAERAGGSIAGQLTGKNPLALEEDVSQEVQRRLTQPGAPAPDYPDIIQKVVGPQTGDATVGDLLRLRKRLRAGNRAAYQADHKNLARQFGELEDAVTADIKNADPRVARMSARLDKDYFKQKASEWYAKGVDEAFDPATGNWDRKRFTKWFEKHADSTNNDRDLRRLLGDQYDSTKALVGDMQAATATNIEGVAKEAARNIKRRYGGEMRDIGKQAKEADTLDQRVLKEIDKANLKAKGKAGDLYAAREGQLKTAGADIETARKSNAADIEAEINKQIKEITGKPTQLKGGTFFGSLAIIHGIAFMNPVAVAGGIATIMTHHAVNNMLKSASGLSILRRLARAAPGTGQAIAASQAAVNFGHALEGQPQDEEQPATMTKEAAPKQSFEQWKAENAPKDSGKDYDLRGAYEAGLKPSAEDGHFSDRFKLPNHPTFSIESQYYKPGMPAGRWEGQGPDAKYVPMTAPEATAYVKQHGVPMRPIDLPPQQGRFTPEWAAREKGLDVTKPGRNMAPLQFDKTGKQIQGTPPEDRKFGFGENPPPGSPLQFEGETPKPAPTKRLKFDKFGRQVNG